MPIAVVVKKSRDGAKTCCGIQKARLLSDVGEGAVSVISIEFVLAIVSYKKIFKSIVVVIANTDAASPSTIEQPRFLGDVCKRAVSIIVVQTIAGTRKTSFQPTPAKEEDVHPAVIVVIEKGASTAVEFHDVLDVIGLAVNHGLGKTRALGNVDEARKGKGRTFSLNREGVESGFDPGRS